MARQTAFGDILRDARKRKGMDLSTVARRLRIRPDILRAIEESDFARMPPRGYTTNMVNAYARLVGLNAAEVGRLYKEQAYAFEVGRVRDDARYDEPVGRSSRTRSSRPSRPRDERPREERPPRQNAFGRTLYDDRTDERGRTYATDRVHPSRHGSMPRAQYTNLYAPPKIPNTGSRLPLVIGGAVIVVLLIIVLFLVFGNRGAAQQEVPQVPISGLTDTSNQTASGAGAPADGQDGATATPPAAVAPTSAKFGYEVKSGQEAYLEVYLDGSTGADVAGTIEGPETKEYNVTGTLRFVTSNPDGVTLTLDGAEVKPTDSRGNGVYTYTVDFPAMLDDWEEEHGSADGDAGSPDTAS